MMRFVFGLLLAFFATTAHSQTIPCYSSNAGGYWGPGMDCLNDVSAGASSLVFRNTITGAIANTKGQTLIMSRNTLAATGGTQDGNGHGTVTIENLIGAGNGQGEHTVAIRHYNYANSGWNPALDVIASKRGAGATFGIAIVAKEETGENDPVEAIEPLEISYEAYGTDLHNKRASAVIAAKCRPDPSAYCEHGYRFVTITEGGANFKRGDVWLGSYIGPILDTKGAGINNFNAISLGLNQAVTWGTNDEARISFDGAAFNFGIGNVSKLQFNANGIFAPGLASAPITPTTYFLCIDGSQIFRSTVPCR